MPSCWLSGAEQLWRPPLTILLPGPPLHQTCFCLLRVSLPLLAGLWSELQHTPAPGPLHTVLWHLECPLLPLHLVNAARSLACSTATILSGAQWLSHPCLPPCGLGGAVTWLPLPATLPWDQRQPPKLLGAPGVCVLPSGRSPLQRGQFGAWTEAAGGRQGTGRVVGPGKETCIRMWV